MVSAAYPEPQPLLELNCVVLGDERNHIFNVEILATKTVSALKKAIKAEKSPLFDHVAADNLVLWKVSVPVDANLEASLAELSFVEEESLLPVERLSKTFSDAPVDGHLHIVVQRPPDGEFRGSSSPQF